MLADDMKELHLAGGRFVKVEDWQNKPTLKMVKVKSGAMLRDHNYMYLGTFKSNFSFTANAFGKVMLKKEDGTIYYDSDGTVADCTPVMETVGRVLRSLISWLPRLEVVAC